MEQGGLYYTALAICSLMGFVPAALLDSAHPMSVASKNQSEKLRLFST